MSARVILGDCREVLAAMPADGIDSCVTDPPYHLTSIVKRFGGEAAAAAKGNDAYIRASRGFMGQTWDGGDVAFQPETWAAVLRVLKPGAHLLAFGGTRTFHRLACAIEDAGFEIRDTVAWLYSQGFPKSLDISRAIDKAAGVTREVLGEITGGGRMAGNPDYQSGVYGDGWHGAKVTAPAAAAGKQWDGWGTALKPAMELIGLARKPLSERTIAANVERHGTGGLNIDGCRIEAPGGSPAAARRATMRRTGTLPDTSRTAAEANAMGRFHRGGDAALAAVERPAERLGRWPANVTHDGSAAVLAGFPDSNSPAPYVRASGSASKTLYGEYKTRDGAMNMSFGDSGSAARFFYSPKADAADRLGSKHPTVKPVDLIAWLVRLVTPPGGTVLDPFAGSGTTAMACLREGVDSISIDLRAECVADIEHRLAHVQGADTPLFAGVP